ncbi:hypothetical protein J6590_024798 [Homalodisca vitripennis]|nr:hypothetical protein J6590_024798 [Homalodisca vitripennis]
MKFITKNNGFMRLTNSQVIHQTRKLWDRSLKILNTATMIFSPAQSPASRSPTIATTTQHPPPQSFTCRTDNPLDPCPLQHTHSNTYKHFLFISSLAF